MNAPAHPRLRLRVTAAAEKQIRAGHPWVFAASVREASRPGAGGEWAVIYDRADRFLAIGLFDPDSPLRVRILHRGKPQTLDTAWWKARLDAAIARRVTWFDERTTGFRWVHGENDGWPGLVLDRYGDTLVLKLYTLAWLPHLAQVQALLVQTWPRARVVLRLSRNIQAQARERFQRHDGSLLAGEDLDSPVIFLESGLHFEADVIRGQKTGFFLDQRENRRRVETLAKGKAVLNVFSYSGGFSLYAARGGARQVTDLDLNAHALAAARRHFGLNTDAVAGCAHECVQADAFEWLAAKPLRRFDLIVLDPPSLAKRQSERVGALQAYRHLARHAVKHLAPSGVLVASSCSAHVPAADFFRTIRQAVRDTGRPFVEIETTRHPPDHPATFAEAHYLKCIYLRVGPEPRS